MTSRAGFAVLRRRRGADYRGRIFRSHATRQAYRQVRRHASSRERAISAAGRRSGPGGRRACGDIQGRRLSAAQIWSAGKRLFLGNWRTARETAEAYDRAAVFYRVSTGTLNFPSRRLPPADAATLRREARIRRAAKTACLFFGVTRSKARWNARIHVDGRARSLGCWATETEAAVAYDRAARFLGYPKARLNFPNRQLRASSPAELRLAAGRARKASASSRYARVYRAAGYQDRPWIAQIRLPRKGVVHLGTWESEDAAARAYDRAARFYLGSNATLQSSCAEIWCASTSIRRAESPCGTSASWTWR